jgi:hypothetical protein
MVSKQELPINHVLVDSSYEGEFMELDVTTEAFKRDLKELPKRIEAYKELARQADRVVITLACSDSRVVVPQGLVEVKTKGEEVNDQAITRTEKVLFVRVPTIGGGAPSRKRLRGVLRAVMEWGVDSAKVNILVTQHGDTKEVKAAKNKSAHKNEDHVEHGETGVTCGLRKFLSQHGQELRIISDRLSAWSDDYKRRTLNPQNAPDRLALPLLEEECPDIMSLVKRLSQKVSLPQRLIIRAAYRNRNFGMVENGEEVRRTIGEFVRDPEYKDLYETCLVGTAHYDHQQKSLIFLNPYANLGFADETITFEDLPRRTDTYQDPENVIISLGDQSISLHKGEILPSFVGKGTDDVLPPADNAFRACSSRATVPTLLAAFAEGAYAVVHYAHPHEGDLNFRNLKRVIVLCDTDEFEQVLRKAVKDPEFIDEYLPMFSRVDRGRIHIVNLHVNEENPQPTYSTISLS